MQKWLNRIYGLGLDYETSYQNKKDLVAFNSTFLWTNILIFINIFVSWLSGLHWVCFINCCALAGFAMLLVLNHLGFFPLIKHLGILMANVYVYFQSLAGGPGLQFQYAYCIIITMIGFVFTKKRDLLVHLPVTILFFGLTKLSYYYIEPFDTIPPDQQDYFASNNGVLFLILISVSAFVFRNQTNFYLNEIESKKNLIEEKQKEIFDSISYAQRIQSAILVSKSYMDKNLGADNYFIQFHPKDIVSGDFYWSAQARYTGESHSDLFKANPGDELFYFAVCDSTGHGVPGAFMSLLSMGYLSEAVNEKHIYSPDKIFGYVRQRLIESLSHEGQKDGFDGILICINKTNGKICYAASNNCPMLVSGKQALHLPADKMPVGKGIRNEDFSLYFVTYHKGDYLYLYTDGYADQFGGPKGKKFKYRQLQEVIVLNAGKMAVEQKQALEQHFREWKGDLEQVDDVCLSGIKL